MRKNVFFVVSLLMILATSTMSAQSFCNSGKIVDIQCGQTISGSTINGSSSFGSARYASCLESITSQTPFNANDVIYRFTVAQPTRVEVTLTGLSADLDLFIFKDCNDGSSCIQKSVQTNNSSENVVFENLSGTYYIVVDGYNPSQKSDFSVSIKCGNTSNCETAPCASATSIECGQTITSNNTTSASRFNKACNYTGCYDGNASYVGNDKVYRLDVAAGTSLLEIFLTGVSSNLDLFVFQGNCNPGSCVATGLKTGVNGETILINNPSGTYYIVVDAPDNQKSNFTLSTKCTTSGINCNQAETLTCGQTYNFSTINGTNKMAYNNYGTCINDTDPVLNPYTGNDRLFKISVPAGRTLEITMSGLSADLDMFLFDVCDNVVVLNAPAEQNGLKGCLARSFEPDNVNEKIVINNASGDYYLVVDAPTADRKSNFTLKIDCNLPCPPALDADCDNVTFYYTGIRDGGYVYTFVAKDNLPSGKWTVSNASGTVLQTTQEIGKIAQFRFNTLDTYTICYEYTDSNGCPVKCCKTICVVDPYKCNAIAATRTNSGYTLNLAGYAAANVVEWKDDQSEQVLGTNTTSINIAAPNPGTCRNICVYVYNPTSKCYTICCVEVCTPACAPANNDCENVSFNYSGTNGALTYSFAVPANYPAGKWIATGGQYGNSVVILSNSRTFSFTFPSAGKYKVGYEYTDGNGCLIQCFKTICVQNPNNCNLVSAQRSGNNFQLTLPNVTASNIKEWRDSETNAVVGIGVTSVAVPVPGINACKIYTVQYYDAASGCYAICAVKVCGPTCAPADTNCSTISYTYNGLNGVLTHTFNVPVSLPEGTWVITGGGSTDASRVISRSFIYTFPSAGTYSVCYTYKDANGCEIQCCRTVCVADPYKCNLVNVVKTNAGFTLSLPGVSANNIVQWRNQQTNTFVAVNQASINVPAPGLNSCVNYTVQYFDPASNCYRICGVTVCGPTCAPADNNCSTISHTYSGSNGALTHTFNVPTSLPEGNWVVTGGGINDPSRVISRSYIYTFPSAGTYTVCYTYKDANGCEIQCCRTVCIADPYNCNLVNVVKTNAGFTLSLPGVSANNIVQWRNQQTNTFVAVNQNSINVPTPGLNSCVNYTVQYFDPASNCYRICGVTVCGPTCAPADNNCSTISYTYSGSNGALTHTFNVPTSLPEGNWVVTGGGINDPSRVISRSYIYTFPSAGTYTVCYTYKDANGCEIQCCRTVCIADPYKCNLVNVVKTNAGFTLSLPGVSANNIVQWRNQQTNTVVVVNQASINVPAPGLNSCVNYTVQYFDPASNCYRICGVTVCGPTCAPADNNCSTISYTYSGSNGALTHTFNVPTSLPEGNWVVTGGGINDPSRVISRSYIYTFPSAGTYTVCYTYKDANGCEIQCCRTVCIADPYNCNLVNVVKTNAGFTLSLPGVSANNIVQWRNQQTNTFVAVNQTSVNVPTPAFNACTNYTVQYFDPSSNCYRICGVTVCGQTCPAPDENCDNVSFTYAGSEGSFRYSLVVPQNVPAGTWTATGGAFGNSEATIGQDRTINYAFPSSGVYTVCYKYRDSNGCEIKCCKTICVVDPFACNRITANKVNNNFNLSISGVNASNIVQWYDSQTFTVIATNTTNISIGVPPVNTCRVISVLYFDATNKCYAICSIKVCGSTCPGVDNDCNSITFDYNGVNGSLLYGFSVPSSVSSNGTWVATGGSFGNVEFVLGQGRNINYTFSASGTYKICYKYTNADGCLIQCCKTICITDPFACANLLVTPNQNSYIVSLTGYPTNAISQWMDEDLNQTIAGSTSSVAVPAPAPGQCRRISVLLFDAATNCYSICGKTICEPEHACGNITNVAATCSGSLLDLSFSLKNNTGNANVDAQFIVVSPAGVAFENCNNVKTIDNVALGSQNVKLQLRSCTTPLKAGNVVTIYVALIDNTANCDLYCPLTPLTFIIPECQNCISQARVVSCPTVVNPVCGCNNITYNNSCEAEREGVTKWSPGVCPGNNVANSDNSSAQIVTPTTPNYDLSNSPNPFSGSTVIRFNLPADMDATVTVMDMDGKVVFEESGVFVAGWNEVNFEETIDLSSGMYFYRLQTTEQVMTKTMVLTKE